jgi:hypothetical protein
VGSVRELGPTRSHSNKAKGPRSLVVRGLSRLERMGLGQGSGEGVARGATPGRQLERDAMHPPPIPEHATIPNEFRC